ncbi:MAG TPA: lysylphosphatidylglycerol synthase transmembrane domain-containing protein [Acidimicrobiales bacterium]|jgi:hypothetical protein|nr:lysylphosphatidylglycerol synthase transmembrane domain-containing protein [Acidimicrobiales bacterium]
MRVRRVVMLAVTVGALVLVWPVLRSVYGEFGDVRRIAPGWLVAIVLTVAAQLIANWQLQRIILRTDRWLDVAAPQLVGNAVSRLVPGGNAFGAGAQVRMLTATGLPLTRSVASLGAIGVIGTITGFIVLPVVVLAATAAGSSVDSRLQLAMWAGAAVLVVILLGGARLVRREGTWRRLAHAISFVQRVLRQPDDPRALEARMLSERDLILDVLRDRPWRPLLLDLVRASTDYLALYLALRATGAHVNPAAVLAAFIVANLAGMIPLTPGGLGFVEAGLSGVLAVAGATQMQADLTVVTYRVAETWLPCSWGVIALVVFQRRHRERRLTELLVTQPAPSSDLDDHRGTRPTDASYTGSASPLPPDP